MGSGVMPLAMATRPSKAARDPAELGRELLVERGPRTRVRGPAEASCVCRLKGRLAALAFGEAIASPVAAAEPGFRRRWSLPLGVGAGSRSSDYYRSAARVPP